MHTTEIGKLINNFADEKYACDWDNTGFNLNFNKKVTAIIICIDVNENVINEAIKKKCNLIVSHHPLLFHKMNKIDNKNYVGKCIQDLAKHDISLYCAHTSMDSTKGGINDFLADMLHLTNKKFVHETYTSKYCKIVVYVPKSNKEDMFCALSRMGCGSIGNYSDCSFSVQGEGRFTPNKYATPAIGIKNINEVVQEVAISAICSQENVEKVLCEIKKVHPYEEVAIDVFPLEKPLDIQAGLGIIGECQPICCREVLDIIKVNLKIDKVRFCGEIDKTITKIAVCGGGGGDFIDIVSKMGAELYITGEIKHNYYVSSKIALVEAGHYDTEKCFLNIMLNSLQNELNNVQYSINVYVSKNEKRAYINY